MHVSLRADGVLALSKFTDKAISQHVQLLGCVCKTCKKRDTCCCSTRLVAPTKKRGKRHNAVCDIAALKKPRKNNQAPARTSQPHWIKEGGSSFVCFGARNVLTSCFWTSVALRIPRMREVLALLLRKCIQLAALMGKLTLVLLLQQI